MDSPRLSIVVPTRNERSNILRYLDSVPEPIRIIVVDDSEDDTRERIRNYRREGATRLIHRPGSVTEARQYGADLCATEWILFTDADIVFPGDYFGRLADCLDGPSDVVYGPKLSLAGHRAFYRWFARGQSVVDKLGIPAGTGSNLLIRAEALRGVGGFDTELTCNEDSELVWRLKRNGYSVRFAPNLPVYAADHRRLARGKWRKLAHSVGRCALLYANLIPRRWRGHDWGYWSEGNSDAKLAVPARRKQRFEAIPVNPRTLYPLPQPGLR